MRRNLNFFLILFSLFGSSLGLAQNHCGLTIKAEALKDSESIKQIIVDEIHALQAELSRENINPELLPLIKKQFHLKIKEFETRFGYKPKLQLANPLTPATEKTQKSDTVRLKKVYFDLEHSTYNFRYAEALDKLILSGENSTTIIDLPSGLQQQIPGTLERYSTESQKIVLSNKLKNEIELQIFDLRKMQFIGATILAKNLLGHEGSQQFLAYSPSEKTMNILDLKTMSNIFENLENPGNFPLISNDGSRVIWKINHDKTMMLHRGLQSILGAVEIASPNLEWIVYRNQRRGENRYYLLRLKDEKIVDLGVHQFGTQGSFSPDGNFFIFEDRAANSLVKVIRLSDLATEEFAGQNPRIFDQGHFTYQVFNNSVHSILYLSQFGRTKNQAVTFTATQNFEQINGRFAYFNDGTHYVLVDTASAKEIYRLPFQPSAIQSFTSDIFVINGWNASAVFYSKNGKVELTDPAKVPRGSLIPLPKHRAIFNLDSLNRSLQLIEYKNEM